MNTRRGLAWFGALALLLVVPPVASSVVGGSASGGPKSEQKQNERLGKHSKLLTKHSRRLAKHTRQLRRLRNVEYGVVRGYMITDAERMEAIKGGTGVTGDIPDNGGRAMVSTSVPVAVDQSREMTLRGAIRSAEADGSGPGHPAGQGGGRMYAVCAIAPPGSYGCAGATPVGTIVCTISSGYNTGTGVLTLVPILTKSGLTDDAAPTPDDRPFPAAAPTCKLPGAGTYNVFITGEFADRNSSDD